MIFEGGHNLKFCASSNTIHQTRKSMHQWDHRLDISLNLIANYKIPWLATKFPDFEKDWNFPDFHLAVATLLSSLVPGGTNITWTNFDLSSVGSCGSHLKAASLISPWLLWWPPAESHYNIYDHSVVGYVSHAHCIALLYSVGNKITTTIISLETPMKVNTTMQLKITHLKSKSHPPGNNELIFKWFNPYHDKPMKICILPGGVLQKILTGVCGPGFRNHTLGYGDWGPKSYPWLWKMGQNRTFDNRKYHQINHFWSNFAWNW